MFALADRLHKTIGEIEAMSLDEFAEWVAFYKTRDFKERPRDAA